MGGLSDSLFTMQPPQSVTRRGSGADSKTTISPNPSVVARACSVRPLPLAGGRDRRHEVERLPVECSEQPVVGDGGDRLLEPRDFATSQAPAAGFELNQPDFDYIGIGWRDAHNDRIDDSGPRSAGVALEEQDLPAIRSTPRGQRGLARLLALPGLVPRATAGRPRLLCADVSSFRHRHSFPRLVQPNAHVQRGRERHNGKP